MPDSLNKSASASSRAVPLPRDPSAWPVIPRRAKSPPDRSAEVAAIVEQLRELLDRPAPAVDLATPEPPDPQLLAREEIRKRALRRRLFGADMFADPVWDMLLLLFTELADREHLKVIEVQALAGVPLTTAVRWLAVLEQRGFVWRRTDRADRRVTNVGLTEHGWHQMLRYFTS